MCLLNWKCVLFTSITVRSITNYKTTPAENVSLKYVNVTIIDQKCKNTSKYEDFITPYNNLTGMFVNINSMLILYCLKIIFSVRTF